MKRTRSALARTLERPAVINVTPLTDNVGRPERWFARAVLIAFAALAIAIVTACATTSTQLRGVWVSPEKGRAPAESVLVVGADPDATARRICEDTIAGQPAASRSCW